MESKNVIKLLPGSRLYTGCKPGEDSVGVYINVTKPVFLVDIALLPKEVNLDTLVSQLEDNCFLAKYFLEKEYKIINKQ